MGNTQYSSVNHLRVNDDNSVCAIHFDVKNIILYHTGYYSIIFRCCGMSMDGLSM